MIIGNRRPIPTESVVNSMLRFAICEDEPETAQALAELLADCMAKRRIAGYTVSRFADGRSLLEGGAFDVVFLDIRMEPPDGMETARLLRRRGDRSLLIFVTALREAVFDAFAVEAADYLVKPLDADRFGRTMDRVLALLERRAAKAVVMEQSGGSAVVPLAEILYCEVLGRRLYLHRSDGSVTDCRGRLEELERRLDRRFFKCHRSYLVNLDHVLGLRDGQVLLPRDTAIPVSRLRARDLTQALLQRMREGEC